MSDTALRATIAENRLVSKAPPKPNIIAFSACDDRDDDDDDVDDDGEHRRRPFFRRRGEDEEARLLREEDAKTLSSRGDDAKLHEL